MKQNISLVFWSVIGLLVISFLAVAQTESVQTESVQIIEGVYEFDGFACKLGNNFIIIPGQNQPASGLVVEFDSDDSTQMYLRIKLKEGCRLVVKGSYTANDSKIIFIASSVRATGASCPAVLRQNLGTYSLPEDLQFRNFTYILQENVLYFLEKSERSDKICGKNGSMYSIFTKYKDRDFI